MTFEYHFCAMFPLFQNRNKFGSGASRPIKFRYSSCRTVKFRWSMLLCQPDRYVAHPKKLNCQQCLGVGWMDHFVISHLIQHDRVGIIALSKTTNLSARKHGASLVFFVFIIVIVSCLTSDFIV
jgi:hypothetical protein